jgi:hypothetical protein
MLIKYWQLIAGAGVALVFAYLLHSVILSASLSAQETELKAACRAAQNIPYEVSNEYQNDLADLNYRLSVLNRVRSCVPISGAPCRCDETAKGQGYGRADGVNSVTLYDYAGDAERYRLQLIACQSFVKKTAQ